MAKDVGWTMGRIHRGQAPFPSNSAHLGSWNDVGGAREVRSRRGASSRVSTAASGSVVRSAGKAKHRKHAMQAYNRLIRTESKPRASIDAAGTTPSTRWRRAELKYSYEGNLSDGQLFIVAVAQYEVLLRRHVRQNGRSAVESFAGLCGDVGRRDIFLGREAREAAITERTEGSG